MASRTSEYYKANPEKAALHRIQAAAAYRAKYSTDANFKEQQKAKSLARYYQKKAMKQAATLEVDPQPPNQ